MSDSKSVESPVLRQTSRDLSNSLKTLLNEKAYLDSVSTPEQRQERTATADMLADPITGAIGQEFGRHSAAAIYEHVLNPIKGGESAVKVLESFVPAEKRAEFHKMIAKGHGLNETIRKKTSANAARRSPDDYALSIAATIEKDLVSSNAAADLGWLDSDGEGYTIQDTDKWKKTQQRLRDALRITSGFTAIKSQRTASRKLSRNATTALSIFAKLS